MKFCDFEYQIRNTFELNKTHYQNPIWMHSHRSLTPDDLHQHFDNYTDAKNNSVCVARRKFTAVAHSFIPCAAIFHIIISTLLRFRHRCYTSAGSVFSGRMDAPSGKWQSCTQCMASISVLWDFVRVTLRWALIPLWTPHRPAPPACYHVTSFCTNCEQVQFK